MSRDRRAIKNIPHLATYWVIAADWPNRKPHHAFGGVSLRAAAAVTAIETVAVAKLSHQSPQLPAFLDGFARIQAVLQRVFLLPRGAPDPGAPPCIRQRG